MVNKDLSFGLNLRYDSWKNAKKAKSVTTAVGTFFAPKSSFEIGFYLVLEFLQCFDTLGRARKGIRSV